jgi:hypothetical protein
VYRRPVYAVDHQQAVAVGQFLGTVHAPHGGDSGQDVAESGPGRHRHGGRDHRYPVRDGEGKARLADPGQPDERDEVGGLQEGDEFRDVAVPADQLGRGGQRCGPGHAAPGRRLLGRRSEERLARLAAEPERVGDKGHGAALRTTDPTAFELAQGTNAHAGSAGQLLLGQAGRQALPAQARGESDARRTGVMIRVQRHGQEGYLCGVPAN